MEKLSRHLIGLRELTMLTVSLGLCRAVMCCAVTCWIETYHAALNCVVLYCLVHTSRPWYPNHDRTDLDLKLGLPGSIARPQLVAVETCGVLTSSSSRSNSVPKRDEPRRGESKPKRSAPRKDGPRRGEPRRDELRHDEPKQYEPRRGPWGLRGR